MWWVLHHLLDKLYQAREHPFTATVTGDAFSEKHVKNKFQNNCSSNHNEYSNLDFKFKCHKYRKIGHDWNGWNNKRPEENTFKQKKVTVR